MDGRLLKQREPPSNAEEIIKAHLNAGWSWMSLVGRFRVTPNIWHRWIKEYPHLNDFNPHSEKAGRKKFST